MNVFFVPLCSFFLLTVHLTVLLTRGDVYTAVQKQRRSLQRKTDQVEGHDSKINQLKEYVSKNDQLQCIRIAVDRFFK